MSTMRAILWLQILLIVKVDSFFVPPQMRLGLRRLVAAAVVEGVVAASETTLPVCDSCEKTIETVVDERTSPVCHRCECEKENLCSVNSVADPRSTQKQVSPLVQSINGKDGFLKALASHEGRPIIIHYFDSCCRALEAIKPRWKALVNTYHTGAAFYEVEFMGNRDLCEQVNIQRLPTLQIYQGSDGLLLSAPCGPKRWDKIENAVANVINKHKLSSVTSIPVRT